MIFPICEFCLRGLNQLLIFLWLLFRKKKALGFPCLLVFSLFRSCLASHIARALRGVASLSSPHTRLPGPLVLTVLPLPLPDVSGALGAGGRCSTNIRALHLITSRSPRRMMAISAMFLVCCKMKLIDEGRGLHHPAGLRVAFRMPVGIVLSSVVVVISCDIHGVTGF